MEQFLTASVDGVTAVYNSSQSRIELKLPNKVLILEEMRWNQTVVAGLFNLQLNGQRLLYREAARQSQEWVDGQWIYDENTIFLPLTPRLKAALDAGGSIILQYTPGILRPQRWTHVSDVTGAFAPAFGPITVTRATG
jgi:hypothetical protein